MSDSVDGSVDWKKSFFAALQERDASQAREAALREKLEVAEKENAELTKKIKEGWIRVCQSGLSEAHAEIAELRKLLESNVPEDIVNDAKRWKWYRDNGNHTCGAMQLEAWVDLHLDAQPKEPKQ